MNRSASLPTNWKRKCRSLVSKFLLLLAFIFSVYYPHAQNTGSQKLVLLKGFITNQNGEPVPNVSIQVKGGSQATTGGIDGSYEIQVPANSTVTISSVGYLSKDIKVGTSDQATLNLQLIANKNELDQVVVVGYGTRKRSDVTGAITSVSEQAIKDIPSSNLATAIQGQAASVDIQRSGANSKPGASPNILIRGTRSLGASNSPLIVVDGIPFNGNINDLNQDDVTSVEILKDASSTAIYGSRGANGVVLITTKRGRSVKPVFTYNGYIGNTWLTDEFPIMDAAEFTDLKKWANIIANPGM